MDELRFTFNPLKSVTPSFFETMNKTRLTWAECLGELIDNSFDADADRIVVRFGPGKILQIADNGFGCDNFEKMLSLGVHYPRKGRKGIGRYGVGLKDAATWLWGRIEVKSRSGDHLIRGSINWPQYSKQTNGDDLPWFKRPAEENDVGTVITFTNIERNFPDFEAIRAELSYLFSPGLQSGKQLIIIHKAQKFFCSAWKLPPFDGAMITDEFQVNGRGVKLQAGVVIEGHPNERRGYSLFYQNRIIKNTAVWASGGNSLARVYATIELDNKWTLGKNKTYIKESMMDELEEEIYKRCELLIARAKKQ